MSLRPAREWEMGSRGVDRRLTMLGRDNDQGRVRSPCFFSRRHPADGAPSSKLDFLNSDRWECRAHLGNRRATRSSISFCPTLTAWKFMPKIVGHRARCLPV